MRNDASFSRLAEMGIDVYLPRMRRPPTRTAAAVSASAVAMRPRVVLFASATSSGEARLLADIEHALRLARVDVQARAASAATSTDSEAGRTAGVRLVFAAAAESQASAAERSSRPEPRDPPPLPSLTSLRANADAKRRVWQALRTLIARMHGAVAESRGVGEARASH